MRDKAFIMQCTYCQGETKIIIKLPQVSARGRKKGKQIQIVRTCQYCNRANLLTIPETWDERQPVLGDDKGILGYSNGIPILQGEPSHDNTEATGTGTNP
jgi:hypothetical protein